MERRIQSEESNSSVRRAPFQPYVCRPSVRPSVEPVVCVCSSFFRFVLIPPYKIWWIGILVNAVRGKTGAHCRRRPPSSKLHHRSRIHYSRPAPNTTATMGKYVQVSCYHFFVGSCSCCSDIWVRQVMMMSLLGCVVVGGRWSSDCGGWRRDDNEWWWSCSYRWCSLTSISIFPSISLYLSSYLMCNATTTYQQPHAHTLPIASMIDDSVWFPTISLEIQWSMLYWSTNVWRGVLTVVVPSTTTRAVSYFPGNPRCDAILSFWWWWWYG